MCGGGLALTSPRQRGISKNSQHFHAALEGYGFTDAELRREINLLSFVRLLSSTSPKNQEDDPQNCRERTPG